MVLLITFYMYQFVELQNKTLKVKILVTVLCVKGHFSQKMGFAQRNFGNSNMQLMT